jgi:hypothetical protein
MRRGASVPGWLALVLAVTAWDASAQLIERKFAAHLLPERTAHASWKTPGGDVLNNLPCFASFGAVPDRWFLQVDPAAPELHPAYRWSVRAFQVGGRLAGIRLPRPEVVPFEDPSPIARWMAGTLRARATPHLQVFTSAAVRLCEAAASAGLQDAVE